MTDSQKAVKRLDIVFNLFIRMRDCPGGAGRCCSCGVYKLYSELDAGHFINRRWRATRWREDNVHAQCRSCNRFDEGNGAGYALFMINKYGAKHVEFLRALSREYALFDLPELNLLTKEYKRKIRELKEQRALTESTGSAHDRNPV